MTSKELADVDAFLAAFERVQEELKQKDLPVFVTEAAKDELGWYTVIRIRPKSEY